MYTTITTSLWRTRRLFAVGFLIITAFVGRSAFGEEAITPIINIDVDGFNHLSATIQGGGLVTAKMTAAMDDVTAGIDPIISSSFSNGTVQGNIYTYGGGLFGSYAQTGKYATARISHVDELSINQVHVTFRGVRGGGLFGSYALGSRGTTATIEQLENVTISNSNHQSLDGLHGGGFLGAYSMSYNGKAESRVSGISQLWIKDSTSRSGTTSGSTVLGSYAYGQGATSTITAIDSAVFEEISINLYNNIQGGGILGAYAEAFTNDASADILSITGFSTDRVSFNTTQSLYGGGLVGSFADGAILSNARVKSLSELSIENSEIDITVNLYGGGLVGAFATTGQDSSALVGVAEDSTFLGNSVKSNRVFGGGMIGSYALDASVSNTATMEGLRNVDFTGDQLEVQTDLNGGGVIGAYAVGGSGVNSARVGTIENSLVTNVSVEANELRGGGLAGAYSMGSDKAESSLSGVDTLTSRDFTLKLGQNLRGGGLLGIFSETTLGSSENRLGQVTRLDAASSVVTVGETLRGGGLLGIHVETSNVGRAIVTGMDASYLSSTDVDVTGDLLGGGLVGAHVESGIVAQAEVGMIDQVSFTGNTVSVGQRLFGGGLVGAYALDASTTNRSVLRGFSNTVMDGNQVTVEQHLVGGGLAGSYALGTKAANSGSFELVSGSEFKNNAVSSNAGVIFGGALYSLGAEDGMEIRDSVFENNRSTALQGRVYGTVTVDTAPDTTGEHRLSIHASAGRTTVFRDNTTLDSWNGFATGSGQYTRNNSIYIGGVDVAGDDNNIAGADARLVISPDKGGVVALYDPIEVNQRGSALPVTQRKFFMDIQGDAEGIFLWGGTNRIFADGGGAVTLFGASTATLLSGFGMESETVDFVTQDGGTLYISLATETGQAQFIAPRLEANNIRLATGSVITLSDYGILDNAGMSTIDYVLDVSAENACDKFATLGNGTLHEGVYVTEFDLNWGEGADADRLFLNRGGSRIDTALAGVSAQSAVYEASLRGMRLGSMFLDRRSTILRENEWKPGVRIWADSAYETASGSGNRHDLQHGMALAVGAESSVSEWLTFGVAAGFSRTTYRDRDVNSTLRSPFISAYGEIKFSSETSLSWRASHFRDSIDQQRTVHANNNRTWWYKSRLRTHSTAVGLTLRHTLFNAGDQGPRIGLLAGYDCFFLKNPGFDEGLGDYTTDPYRLHQDKSSLTVHQVTAGMETGWNFTGGFQAGLGARYRGLVGRTDVGTTGYLTRNPDSTTFATRSDRLERHTFIVDANFRKSLGTNASVEVSYSLQAGRKGVGHRLALGLSVGW